MADPAKIRTFNIADAVYAVDIHADAYDQGVMHVTLGLASAAEIDGKARVVIKEATHKALVALGWTPPADEVGTDG